MALKFPFKKTTAHMSSIGDKTEKDYEFSQALNLFKSQREKIGFSLEELSYKTKISMNVLIAIENGWQNYLPEKTYLNSMLKKLEVELSLEIGSLNGLLDQKVIIDSLPKFNFNFINIDFLNSWIGSLIYFIFMLLSILALNIQQKYLLKINSLSTEPVIINNTDKVNNNTINNK